MPLPSEAEIRTLLDGEDLPKGAGPLLEEALRHADARGDVDLAFKLRLKLFQYFYTDERCYVAFSWCLARFEREPQRFADSKEDLLWGFHWIAGNSHCYPQITRAQIEGLLDQMELSYRRHGYSLRAVYQKRWWAASAVGDRERARKLYRAWRSQPDGDMNECTACENDARAEWFAGIDQHRRAVHAAEGILAGWESCYTVPHHTLALLLRSFVALGRTGEAEACHRKGYRLIVGKADFLYHLAFHLAYLGHSENFARGVDVLQRNLPLALETTALNDRCRFFFAAAVFLRRLAGRKASRKLRLPAGFPLHVESGDYDLQALADWFEARASEIGERFDLRNGNDDYTSAARRELDY